MFRQRSLSPVSQAEWLGERPVSASRASVVSVRAASRVDAVAAEWLYWASVSLTLAITTGVLSCAAGMSALHTLTAFATCGFGGIAIALLAGATWRVCVAMTRVRPARVLPRYRVACSLRIATSRAHASASRK